jgi:dTDP-4-dehydrorhamnose reductase
MRILILGVGGLIGNNLFQLLSNDKDLKVFGLFRDNLNYQYFDLNYHNKLFKCDLILSEIKLLSILNSLKPDVVINTAGITNHKKNLQNPLKVIPINSLFPHKLNNYSEIYEFRLIHISSDCVFNGESGDYSETDNPNALDLYGISKNLGELKNSRAITLRTSFIGHELFGKFGLLEWFLNQETSCQGYSKAYFNGLTAKELSKIIKYVIMNYKLKGLYNIGSSSIDKYSLLNIISKIYNKKIDIKKNENYIINRTLSIKKFTNETGYIALNWEQMIAEMNALNKNKYVQK